MVSPDGRDGSVTINADASIRNGLFDGDERFSATLDPARKVYVQLLRGSLRVNGQTLQAGDALRMEDEAQLTIDQGADAEVLVFDLH